ncbi:MAG: acetyltransferase [Prevotella sp.]|nr:acetyltransferase [Prevotella sp.]
MKDLIIVGAGGMGRTIYDMARENESYEKEFAIKGFIDDNLNSLDGFKNYPPILGKISDYEIQPNDIFVCSIGGNSRRSCMESIIHRGGNFFTLIHPTSRIGTNVHLGRGCYVGAFTTIAADAYVDDYNFIQSHTIIGHDVHIGKWNRIDSYVLCVGGIKIGEGCMIHTNAVLNHNVEIGNEAHVGACSFVVNSVPDGATVFGNPARRLK